MKHTLFTSLLPVVVLTAHVFGSDSNPPNVVFLLADDLGVKDLGCYGSDFHETPAIDRLAAEGMRFINAYASHPVCGPSRTAIMGGRTPVRMGLTGIPGNIRKVAKSWPEVLQEAGYTTYFTGKWQMSRAGGVTSRGFDYNVAGDSLGQPADYYYPYKFGNGRDDVPDMENGQPGDYLTDKLTDKALAFLDQHHEEPFLLYFSFYQVHKPACCNAQGREDLTAHFKKKLLEMEDSALRIHEIERGVSKVTEALNQRNPEFASQVAAMDENVGRLMQKLEELGIANETIVIFTSDQGSMCTSRRMVSSQQPYSMGKSFLYEGGIRAPLIVKWPGQIEASSTNETVTLNTDLYPTVLDILDLPLRPEQHKDGISLKPALKGDHIPFDRVFRWAYPPRHALGHVTSTAIRKGNYKLIYWYRHGGKTELYNVVEDVGESRDLSEGMPEKREAMLSELNEPDYMSPFRP